MRLEVVQLENIRSHIKSTVPFSRGFNCLVGGLGRGKSSILYAIDFALFGDPIGRSFEYLLREDTESGRVTVQFTQNGKTYRLTRGIKRRGKGISQDFEELKLFEEETLIASIKNDAIAEQLKALTGLDRDIFWEIIWVRQERLKELLDTSPRERQKRLDELFGLSDYETAWTNIASYQRDYQTEKRIYEKDPDITGMEKLGLEYNRIAEEFAGLEIELQSALSKLAKAKKEKEKADATLSKLEEKRLFIEELKRKETKITTNIANLKELSASLKQRMEGKKTILENLSQRKISIDSQMGSYMRKLNEVGISPSQPLESIRLHLTNFENRILNLKAEQETIARSVNTDEKRAKSLSIEDRCPMCLQPLNEEYKKDLQQRLQEENLNRQENLKRLQKELEELQRVKMTAAEAFSNLQTLNARAEDLKGRLTEEDNTLTDLLSEIENKSRFESDLTRQLEMIRLEISRFDVSELETARLHKEQILRECYVLESNLHTMENRKKDLARRLDETKERIDNAQTKLERMQKITRIIEILGAIRDAYRSIQPKLRVEFVRILRNFVQQMLDGLIGGETPILNVLIDETYTPSVKSESGSERDVAYLSGGERTLLAFAYRLGLGQLIMQSRTGHGLSILLLDEPTESLGSEDGSIDRLAEAISRLKAIEQIIAVTHSEAFAEKAGHVLLLEKEAGISRVSLER